MASLKAFMTLMTGGFASGINKVIRDTDRATSKILSASGVADSLNLSLDVAGATANKTSVATKSLNMSLEATGATISKARGSSSSFKDSLEAINTSANKASSGLGKYISIAAMVAGAIKGIKISDEYSNTAARLNLINDGMQTQLELQDKIFAAANRSRGAYSDMAGAVSKMGLLAKDAFTSNDELIVFTELVQKSFKVSGADTSEQQGAMRQLSQAMASGRLQGDELVSIIENGPMVYDAIAKYMGKSKGELKKLSSEGVITSDIIKSAIFMAADDINTKFEKMPKNFGDVWNKIKNGATKAARPLIEKINKIINSEKFDKFIDGMINGFNKMADAAGKGLDIIGKVYNFVSDNWDKLDDIVYAAAGAWLAYKGALLAVKVAQWAVNIATMANPIGLIILLVTALAAAFVLLWEKCEGFREFWASVWSDNMKSAARTYNFFANINNKMSEWLDMYIESLQSFVNIYRLIAVAVITLAANMAKAIINSLEPIIDLINKFISQYNAFAKVLGMKSIDFKLNKEGLNSTIDKLAGQYIDKVNGSASGINSFLDKIQLKKVPLFDTDDLDMKIDDMSKKIEGFSISGWIGGIFGDASKALYDAINENLPIEITGDGPNGAVSVSMDDEDISYLRDIAEREYINKFSTATLAPNVTFTFGDIHETADVEKLKGTLEMMMREEIAVAAEGAYNV